MMSSPDVIEDDKDSAPTLVAAGLLVMLLVILFVLAWFAWQEGSMPASVGAGPSARVKVTSPGHSAPNATNTPAPLKKNRE